MSSTEHIFTETLKNILLKADSTKKLISYALKTLLTHKFTKEEVESILTSLTTNEYNPKDVEMYSKINGALGQFKLLADHIREDKRYEDYEKSITNVLYEKLCTKFDIVKSHEGIYETYPFGKGWSLDFLYLFAEPHNKYYGARLFPASFALYDYLSSVDTINIDTLYLLSIIPIFLHYKNILNSDVDFTTFHQSGGDLLAAGHFGQVWTIDKTNDFYDLFRSILKYQPNNIKYKRVFNNKGPGPVHEIFDYPHTYLVYKTIQSRNDYDNELKASKAVYKIFGNDPGEYTILPKCDGDVLEIIEIYDEDAPRYKIQAIPYKRCHGTLDKLTFINMNTLIVMLNNIVEFLLQINTKGLHHFDIKPENILYNVTNNGDIHCVLGDYGLIGDRHVMSDYKITCPMFLNESIYISIFNSLKNLNKLPLNEKGKEIYDTYNIQKRLFTNEKADLYSVGATLILIFDRIDENIKVYVTTLIEHLIYFDDNSINTLKDLRYYLNIHTRRQWVYIE
jgi:hypothetical protein